mmetsp:Transcript_7930/g.23402  ORF Transcript_7930/g.23402 Transcript_7930/m.23402 type:complete len:1211 (+) Transcript_7930:263-3895(+)
MPPVPRQVDSFVSETTGLIERRNSLSFSSLNEIVVPDELEEQSRPRSEFRSRDESKESKVVIGGRDLSLLSRGALLLALVLAAIVFGPSSIGGDCPDAADDTDDEFGDRFPLSLLDPVRDLDLAEHGRPWNDPSFPAFYYDHDKNDANPSNDPRRKALPTNAWYQNLLQVPQNQEPANLQRVYTGPYLVDVVGTIPGLRVHAPEIDASDMVVQLTFNERFGVVLGGSSDSIVSSSNCAGTVCDTESHSHRYKVLETTELGITLEWDAMKMTSNIVKGMPFATMEYEKSKEGSNNALYPTIAAQVKLRDPILVDGEEIALDCSKKLRVERDIELYFRESDYSWMAFFSEPVWIQCSVDDAKTLLQVVNYDEDSADDGCSSSSNLLVVRLALVDQCTNGWNAASCRQGIGHRLPDEPVRDDFVSLLRAHANTYPGRHTAVDYAVMPKKDGKEEAKLFFDWDAKKMSNLCRNDPSTTSSPLSNENELLMFALPHQMDLIPAKALPHNTRYCKSSLIGPTCIVQGNKWTITQELPRVAFRAKRPLKPEYIPTLAKALTSDIEFKIPDYFKRGAGDTYFSGKILAKLARILLIAEEVLSLCGGHVSGNYLQFCKNSTLPTEKQMNAGIQELREGVEVWINGTAETPLVYDTSWGGVVSCGCYFDGTQCTNRFPNCPAFVDPGLNFGNGFYNDHHFHYGYHIFAAAAVSHFDNVWGMDNFESVLLLVRDIANPSEEDEFFPLFRHKDWYQGSSWASGIPYPAYLNGKNQESSSEAIAAYESVAIFGQVMKKIWGIQRHKRYTAISKQITDVGKLMAATELVSAKRYWHVSQDQSGQRIYPEEYDKPVIGILWQTMAQFGTWFGAKPYLPIGIQLLPLTPISEDRDDIEWMNSIYKSFTYSCATDFECTESGWAILQLATLATIGYSAEALRQVKELPDESFTNAGGNGESRSNTIWYITTRDRVKNRIPMVEYDKRGKEEVGPKALYELRDCHLPDTCTEEVLDRDTGDYTCRVRIAWLIYDQGHPQWEACWRVAGLEFPDICGPCDPGKNFVSKELSKEEKEEKNEQETAEDSVVDHSSLECPPCTKQQCNSDLNRCPVYKRTFACTEGTSKGGCSGELRFWLQDDQCDACCEMTHCLDLKDKEARKFTRDGDALTVSRCPPCKPEVCYGKLNQCPIHTAPYLCTKGLNTGGCASSEWNINEGDCQECCELKLDC